MTTEAFSARSPWGGVELLERAIGYTRFSLAMVTPALMWSPTPCDGWDLRALLVHMYDSLTSLHEAGSVRRVPLHPAGSAPTDLIDALRERACQLLAEWSLQGGPGVEGATRDVLVDGAPVTPRVLTSAGALEVAVHGWDVAVACGAPRPIPGRLAADLLRVAPALVREADRPARFGPRVSVPASASASDRLLAFLGRHP